MTHIDSLLQAEVFGEAQILVNTCGVALTHHVDVALVRHALHRVQLPVDVQWTSGLLANKPKQRLYHTHTIVHFACSYLMQRRVMHNS